MISTAIGKSKITILFIKFKTMRYTFLLTLLIIGIFESCQSEENTDEVQEKQAVNVPDTCICDDLILDDKYKHYYYHKSERTEPFTGTCYTLFTNSDQKKMIKPLIEGKVEGKVQEFYSNGSLKAEYWFNQNHVYDSLKRYFPDGRVKYHAIYQCGQIKDILVNEIDDSTIIQ